MRNLQEISQKEYVNQFLLGVIISVICTGIIYYCLDNSFWLMLLGWPLILVGIIVSINLLVKYIKYNTMDEYEWREYARTHRAFLSKATYTHPLTNDTQTVRRGFSIPVFLFADWVPLFRGQWSLFFKFFIIIFTIAFLGLTIPVIGPLLMRQVGAFALARRYNSMYENWLIKQGYILEKTEYINDSASKVRKQINSTTLSIDISPKNKKENTPLIAQFTKEEQEYLDSINNCIENEDISEEERKDLLKLQERVIEESYKTKIF
ncbi:hypothetical protein [Bacteroides sp. 224]|uniref:hypothetical protein n=1 Tax=Bacteroides sp. 224 TaxID=2302936 RepID=UPI0013D82B5F|nr:hypothetical protein [Bacteroides sp. 224]NDV66343.1 hypothetical protein [Bacteroides sp. 224]